MAFEQATLAFGPAGTVLLGILLLWSIIWKAIALWKSARNTQIVWFVLFIVFSTAGILPIIYLLFFQKKRRR